ncbi:MAG: 50S ribosomal protein L3 [Planctomycetaceae bacterium]|nr:50S ribosomal protein L3 [Planctomycetaceae bacterium]
MAKGILGRKVGMTQVYDENGSCVSVTVIEAGPCVVLQVRTPERDGYSAVQLGFADKPRRLASRAERGHVTALGSRRQKAQQAAGATAVAKAECEPKRFVREFRTDGEQANYEVGQVLTVASLSSWKKKADDKPLFVDVIGTVKGRGFTGVMKKYNFHGLCASHGVKKAHRSLGSTGQRQDPGRVFLGQKMPGRWGNERSTVRGLKVVRCDEQNNLLLVYGSVPGHNGAFVMVRETTCV